VFKTRDLGLPSIRGFGEPLGLRFRVIDREIRFIIYNYSGAFESEDFQEVLSENGCE